jgi:hypothetical protein
MHKKFNYKSDFTLFKSFWKSTQDILGMHKNIELQILFNFFQNVLEVHLEHFGNA